MCPALEASSNQRGSIVMRPSGICGPRYKTATCQWIPLTEKARHGGGRPVLWACKVERTSSCEAIGGCVNWAASGGGTMAESFGLRRRLDGFSEGSQGH